MRPKFLRITSTGWRTSFCKCAHTLSEVGEEFVSSEEQARTELSYASARGSEYVAPPIENPILIPIPAPCHPCGLSTIFPALEEISEEPAFICEDLDSLLREVDEERARELQEGSSNLVVRSTPRVGSEAWRRLNGIHHMHPGPGRRCEDLFLISSTTHSFSPFSPCTTTS